MDTRKSLDPSKLGQEEKMKAFSSLLLLKEKQTGQIKGRACINGDSHRAYTQKKAAAPIISTESIFINAAIAASKNRKVQCYDVLSAFVNMDIDKDV